MFLQNMPRRSMVFSACLSQQKSSEMFLQMPVKESSNMCFLNALCFLTVS